MKYICGIDPANELTAAVICECDSMRPIWKRKAENELMLGLICENVLELENHGHEVIIVIEGIQSYGSAIGATTIETCYWIGEMKRQFKYYDFKQDMVLRSEERSYICHTARANDAQIKNALIERFAPHDSNHGKGTVKKPGFFYGFKADIWQAFAVALTYKLREEERAWQH